MARILVIEDNPDNLDLMSYLLTAYGHTVTFAEDGRSGIDAARAQRPDLVACDIHIPGIDGYGVAEALKSDPAMTGIPVIAVTALAMVGDREKILAAGFNGYLTKPIDPQSLVDQIDAFLPAEQRGSKPDSGFVQSPAPLPDRGRKLGVILVVDDSSTNLDLIHETLEPYGYDVRRCESVHAGMDTLRDCTPDLILSDLHMPGENGFNFVRRVRADPRLATIPFIFISSSVWGEDDRAKALSLGISRFLLRPIEPAELLREIARYVPARKDGADGEDPGR